MNHYFDEQPTSNREKLWAWLIIMCLSILGMGFGTRTLSALIVSTLFALVYIVSVPFFIVYTVKYIKEFEEESNE